MNEQNYQPFWNEVMSLIREEYKQQGRENEFTHWWKLTYVKDTLSEITVEVPSKFMWDYMVKQGYIKEIQEKLFQMTGQEILITYVAKNSFSTVSPSPDTSADTAEPAKDSVTEKLTPKPQEQAPSFEEKPVFESKLTPHPQLHEEWTFETFVPSENTDLAYKAALAVAENPGKLYNPLVIYGGVGLGKSHLMNSIGNYIYKHSKGKSKICFINAESFTNEFTNSIRDKTTEKFTKKYREQDVLLLDDIHFFEGKERTQEELFHTFEALEGNKKQMVFTCDRPLTDLSGFEPRLLSRCNKGLTANLTPPNYETRCAILQKKTELMGKKVPEEIIDFIAKNAQSNVRELEGCLTTIFGYADLMQAPLTIEIAQKILQSKISQAVNSSVTIDTIQKVVADHYNISISDMKSKKRNKKVVIPRQIAIYLSRELCGYSYPELGNEFGGKDHTSIMHSYNKISSELKTDPILNSTIQLLTRNIQEFKR